MQFIRINNFWVQVKIQVQCKKINSYLVNTNEHIIFLGFGQSIEEAKNVAAMNALCKMFGFLDSSQPLQFNTKINMQN